MGSDAALEAFYRFVNNEKVNSDLILESHARETARRVAQCGTVVAVHDTTHMQFGTKRTGLGVTTNKHHFGFVAHASLVLSETDGLPLGVAHVETLTRSGKKWERRKRQGQRMRANRSDARRESLRWLRGVEAVEDTVGEDASLIHITDAEGDFFELLEYLVRRGSRFVVRAGQLDRLVQHQGQKRSLRDVVTEAPARTARRVALSERRHPRRTNISTRKRHPARKAREAKLTISVCHIELKSTRYSGVSAEPFQVSVVRVWERRPPKAEVAVEWVLLTTENVGSNKALERIVDLYRKRWVIEEYFKALKSGCSFERRQLGSYDALRRVLALFVPIAYRLLLLRGMERLAPRARATTAFSTTELELMARAPSNSNLDPPKTVADAIVHLARLGGHIRNNGPPGWQTLSWGYEKLLTMRLGWELATKANEM